MKSIELRCHCGRRIVGRDVVLHSLEAGPPGQSLVYLRFRCSRCKCLGERYLQPEEWVMADLREIPSEMTAAERTRFEALPPISDEEVAAARAWLERPDALRGAARRSPFPPGSDRRRRGRSR